MMNRYRVGIVQRFSMFIGRDLTGLNSQCQKMNKIGIFQHQNRLISTMQRIKMEQSIFNSPFHQSAVLNTMFGSQNINLRRYSELKKGDKEVDDKEKIIEPIESNSSTESKEPSESSEPIPPKKGFIVRLKYFLLRQNRPFNVDELTAFFSWILMGNFLWIFIGTTTFFGVILYIMNWVGDGEIEKVLLKNLLTFDNKLNVDLTAPHFKASWEDGKIKIRNLKVDSPHFQLKISELYLTFSFNKWFDGKGLIDEIEIEGLQGDVNMFEQEDILLLDESFNDKYELNHIKVKHSKINFHSEKYLNKPLELIVFNCDMDRLRREWMVYDFLNANTMFGSLGGSLFTLHKRQHRFAHFSGMDLHDEMDDFSNSRLKMNSTSINKGINRDDESGINNHMSATSKINNENRNSINDNEMNDQINHNITDDEGSGSGGDLWKKITRLRIDMLDLSFLNNKNSKLNWIESGKAEVIFDIMLPNEEDVCHGNNGEAEWKFDYSIDGMKKIFDKIYKKLTDEEIVVEKMNKYVVIDMKINYFNLTAKFPEELPVSSLTGLPYMTSKDLQSLVTFINDEKFGLSSNKFIVEHGNDDDINEFEEEDSSDYKDNSDGFGEDYGDVMMMDGKNGTNNMGDDDMVDDSGNKIKVLPAIKFRIVQNLKDFEYVDLPSLLSFSNMKRPEDECNEKVMKSFINTNKFIDNSIVEVLSLLLVYKEEIQTRLIEMYSRRSGFEILFNNFILGNLILVGLGSFVI